MSGVTRVNIDHMPQTPVSGYDIFAGRYKEWTLQYLNFIAPDEEKKAREIKLTTYTAYTFVIEFFSCDWSVCLQNFNRLTKGMECVGQITLTSSDENPSNEMEKYVTLLQTVVRDRIILNEYYLDQLLEKSFAYVTLCLGFIVYLADKPGSVTRLISSYYLGVSAMAAVYGAIKAMILWNIVQKKEQFLQSDVNQLRQFMLRY